MHERTRKAFRAAAIIFAASMVSVPSSAKLGTCDDPYDFAFFRFELTGAVRNERGDFVGTFEIENIRFEKDVVLEGTINRGVFEIDYPQVHLEFMDLNGTYRSFMYSPGTFFAPPNKLRLPVGGKVSFKTQLPTNEQLEFGGSKFRVVLSASPDVCVRSEPFSVIQKRSPIEGFKHDERANITLEWARSKQRTSER